MPSDARENRQLPLKPVDFLILVILTENELHGYGLVQEIARRTRDRIKLVPGNFYAILKRMIGAGLIEEAGRKATQASGDKRRRYYRITKQGRRAAAEEARRMNELVRQPEVESLLKSRI